MPRHTCSMNDQVSVTIRRQAKYRFVVDFGAGVPASLVDEPAPLGDGEGPSPPQLLAAAVANCLSASLVFAHAKFKEDPGRIVTTAVCEIGRNAQNRLRVSALRVSLTLGVAPEALGRLDRVLAQFEDFCTVTRSVEAGIPCAVTVLAPDGRVLKAP